MRNGAADSSGSKESFGVNRGGYQSGYYLMEMDDKVEDREKIKVEIDLIIRGGEDL